MLLTKLKAGAVVLLASCTIASLTALSPGQPLAPAAEAGGDSVVETKGHILTPGGERLYVNVYSTDELLGQEFLFNYVTANILPEIKRVRGVGSATSLGDRTITMRIRLNPDHMRDNKVSPKDIIDAFSGCSLFGSADRTKKSVGGERADPHRLGRRYSKPEAYENIILKATPEGEILRLKDVAEVEFDSQSVGIESDVDGHPSAGLVLKQASGGSAAEVIAAVKEKLEEIQEAAFPPGMASRSFRSNRRDMIYAVIETPRGSTLEYTSAKCHELAAIAKGIDEITSVSSLAGYELRTEDQRLERGDLSIHLKDRSGRKLTSRQIIETLEEKCRTMNVHLEFFEPPAVSAPNGD